MQTRSTLMMAAVALVAAASLGLSVADSTARRLELSRTFRGLSILWNPLVMESAGATVRCRVMLTGTIEEEGGTSRRTFAKTAGLRLGAITTSSLESCEGGTAMFLSTGLPWSLTYQAFSGTLPNITGITFDILGLRLSVAPTGLPSCLITTERSEPFRGIGAVRADALGHLQITTLRADERSAIRLGGSFLCEFASRATLSGTGIATGITGGETPLLALIN